MQESPPSMLKLPHAGLNPSLYTMIAQLYDDLPSNTMPCLGRRQSHDYRGAHTSVTETSSAQHLLFYS
jgi:hypothetical protein